MAAIGAADPNVGKTNQKWCRFILDTADLSGDTRQVGSFGATFDTNDLSGYSAGVHHFQLGHANHIFNGYQAVFSNAATVGSHIELKDQEEYIASYVIGVKAPPEIGSAAWLSSMEQLTYDVSGGSSGTLIDVDLAKAITDNDHIIPYGVALAAGTAGQVLGAHADNAGVDNLVATTNGFVAHLHVVYRDGTADYAFTLESSADDEAASYANVATFVSTAAAVSAERLDVAGAVARYIRFKAVRTAGACRVWCTIARGIDL
jgi:hypothetical protein